MHGRGLGKPEYLHAHAEKFADNPGIVGYDMLNEPFGDDALQLSPLFEDVAAMCPHLPILPSQINSCNVSTKWQE